MTYTLNDHITGEIYHTKKKSEFQKLVIDKMLDYGKISGCYVRLYEITLNNYIIVKKED